jgi:SnoaL-like domain
VTEQELRELLGERLERLSPAAADELRHPDYVLEMPQSGERIRGEANLRRFRAAYPDPPTIHPRRVVGAGHVWVVEAGRVDSSGQVYVVAVLEFRDGKILRDTRWFGAPSEVPAWRAQFVERTDGLAEPDAK